MNIIAEIGTSHGGSFDKAKKLIDACADSGADSVKFQWVYAEEILHPETGFVTLPGGKTPLFDRFRELEVSQKFFSDCLDYTHSLNMKFVCSPFGLRSLQELCEIKPDAIKIASPEVNHIPLLKKTAEYYGKIPVILSSGVSKLRDIEKAVEILTSKNQFEKNTDSSDYAPLTLLHCSTFYPTPEEEYNVKCVKTLRQIFGIPTGISDHSLNPFLVPVLTTAMGGTVIEKHITLSKKTDGLDDPVALEPEEFAFMVHCVNQTEALIRRYKNDQKAGNNNLYSDDIPEEAMKNIINQLKESFTEDKIVSCLGNGIKKLSTSEAVNYGRTNRSLHYLKDFESGHVIKPEDIGILRTEKILTPGIHPEFYDTITGKKLKKSVTSGSGVQFEDFFDNF